MMKPFKSLTWILPVLIGTSLLANISAEKKTGGEQREEQLRRVQGEMRVAKAQDLSPAIVQELKAMPQSRSMSKVEAFLDANPESSDSAFLLFTAGRGLYQAGSYSRALDVLERAWEKAQTSATDDWKEEKLVARIAADLGGLYARLGRLEELESLLEEMKGRPISGAQTLAFDNLRQAVDSMRNRPEVSFRCGPAALETLFKEDNPNAQIPEPLRSAASPREGVSVATLEELSNAAAMPYRAVRTNPLQPPVPSVVHWKAGHYAAIVEKTDEGYLVKDPTFMRTFIMTADALAEESSGVFLVPENKVKPTQRAIPASEKAQIRGRGAPSQSDSENQGGSGDDKCPAGLPEYSFNDFYAALVIKDSPLFYTPPYGPEVAVQLYYFDAGNFDNTTSEVGHPGRKWFLGWSRYLENTNTGGATPSIRMAKRDGRTEVLVADTGNPAALTSTLSRTQIGITNDSQGQLTSLTKNLPDGSVETYGHKHEVFGETDKFYITSLTDPHGNSLTFEYHTGTAKLRRVLDALGRATTIHYSDSPDGVGADNPNRFTISAIKDPFGRTVRFFYDGSERLTRLIDVEGNETLFRYTDSVYTDFITEMETPYGISLFEKSSTTSEKELLITDPVGNQERLQFKFSYNGESLPGVNGFTAVADETPVNLGFDIANGQVWYGYLYYGVTLHWDKKAMDTLKKDPTLNENEAAHQTRWLQAGDNFNILTGTASSRRPALSHREWYRYPDQINAGTFGSYDQPTTTVRRIKDETGTWVNEITYASYNSLGNLTSYTDALGRETIYNYAPNEIDLLSIQRRANGSPLETLVTYSGYGSVDTPHLPTTMVDAAGQTTTMEWTAEGLMRRVIDPNSHVTRYDYDANGYLEAIFRSAPNTPVGSSGTLVELASFDYDTKDRVNKITFSDGYDLDFEFDDLNRLIKTTYPDGTTEETGFFAVTADTFTDRLGRTTWMELDGNGQPLMVIDPDGRITQFRWCSCGAMRSYTDPEGRTTRWKRDLHWRVTEKVYHDDSKDSYSFDPASGWMDSMTRAKDQGTGSTTESYSYFIDGQIASLDFADTNTADISYTYHPVHGRTATVTQAASVNKVTTFTYHPVDGLTLGADQLHTINGPFVNDTIRYIYDTLGRVSGMDILDDSSTVLASQSITFDALERVKTSTTPLGTFTNIYDGLTERISSATHPNGIQMEYAYHNLLGDKRLQSITNRTGTNTSDIVSTFDYIYNPVGNITEWGIRSGQGARNAWTLDYNPVDELTDAVLKNPSAVVLEDLAWRFDRAGNRRLAREGSIWTGYNVNELNELTEVSDGDAHAPISGTLDENAIVTVQGVRARVQPTGSGTFTFEAPLNVQPDANSEFTVRAEDASGNAIESTFAAPTGSFSNARSFVYDDNGNLTDDGMKTYRYDAANRLVGIDYTDGSSTDIEYDAFSRRDRIVERDATAAVTSDKRYIWSGLELLEERETATDTVIRRFYFEGEERLAGPNAGDYFYFRDHLGSIRELVDTSGAIRVRYDYGLWGERTKISGDLDTESAYTGHWSHQVSGLHLAPFRAYESSLGRWTSRDRLGSTLSQKNAELWFTDANAYYEMQIFYPELIDEGPNLFSYVGNRSPFDTDPSGEAAPLAYGAVIVGGIIVRTGAKYFTKRAAARAAAKGKDLVCKDRSTAKDIAQQAGKGKGKSTKPQGPEQHGPSPQYRPHYHNNDRSSGHVFY